MTEPNAAQPALASRWGDLRVRAISGLVMIIVAIGTAWVGGEVFVLVWLAAAIAVLWEWQRLIGGPALRARVWLGAVALVAAAVLARRDLLFEALAFLALYSLVLAWLAGPGLRLWAWGGLVYAGILLAAVIGLRFGIGATAILWLFATVWTTDISAYFGGRLIGGPKLWPRVSPSKTWSGTCVGLAGGALLGTYVGTFAFPAPISVLSIVVVTILASAFSQAGDAGESAMKRAYGVKDSSRLIPGHGGFMDRLDGFIAAAGLALCVFGVLRHFA